MCMTSVGYGFSEYKRMLQVLMEIASVGLKGLVNDLNSVLTS